MQTIPIAHKGSQINYEKIFSQNHHLAADIHISSSRIFYMDKKPQFVRRQPARLYRHSGKHVSGYVYGDVRRKNELPPWIFPGHEGGSYAGYSDHSSGRQTASYPFRGL